MRILCLVLLVACGGGGDEEEITGDPCATDNGGCDELAACTAVDDAVTCGACPAGFDGTGDTACVDLDECATDNGGCDALVACTNTAGAHSCGACPVGFAGTGDTACTDIDECATANGGCDALVACTNTDGGRTCGDCPAGFTGTGDTACTDIDECAMANGGCDALTTCTNIDGGRTCGACPASHAGTGETGCVEPISCADDDLEALTTSAPQTVAITPSCGGNLPICCPNNAPGTCSLTFDYELVDGDLPRYATSPVSNGFDATFRARVTSTDLVLTVPIAGDCVVEIDSKGLAPQDLRFDASVRGVTGPALGFSGFAQQGFSGNDFRFAGLCSVVNEGPFVEELANLILDTFQRGLVERVCSTCPCEPD